MGCWIDYCSGCEGLMWAILSQIIRTMVKLLLWKVTLESSVVMVPVLGFVMTNDEMWIFRWLIIRWIAEQPTEWGSSPGRPCRRTGQWPPCGWHPSASSAPRSPSCAAWCPPCWWVPRPAWLPRSATDGVFCCWLIPSKYNWYS